MWRNAWLRIVWKEDRWITPKLSLFHFKLFLKILSRFLWKNCQKWFYWKTFSYLFYLVIQSIRAGEGFFSVKGTTTTKIICKNKSFFSINNILVRLKQSSAIYFSKRSFFHNFLLKIIVSIIRALRWIKIEVFGAKFSRQLIKISISTFLRIEIRG